MNKQRVIVYVMGAFVAVVLVVGFAWVFSGCASATKIKQEIGSDLAAIIQTQDCPTICFALKAYMRTRLGMEVPE